MSKVSTARLAREAKAQLQKLESFKNAVRSEYGGVRVASFTFDAAAVATLDTADKLGFALVLHRDFSKTGSWDVRAVQK